MSDRPNVLFIVLDQLRADCVDGALSEHVNLPNMRKLMNDGVCFANHYSVAAPCGPSRASLLTGQYAMNHRSVRNGTPLAGDTPNVATEVRKAGYLPLLYGYTDCAQDPRRFHPNDPILKSYEEVMPGFSQVLEMRYEESWPWRGHLASKGYDVPPFPDIYAPQGGHIDDPALYGAEDSDTAFLTDRFLEDILPRPQGWFAHVTYVRPHPPLVAPAPYNKLYPPAALPKPVDANSNDAHPFDDAVRAYTPMSSFVVGFPDLPKTQETAATLRSLYLGLATEVDTHIGRIFEALQSSGQYGNTLVIVTSDHGEMLGDYGMWGKSTYHDAAYHVPLIVKTLGDQSIGLRIEHPTESIDVVPTILDLCRIDQPDSMDGRSLRPFLTGQDPNGWRTSTWSELDFGDPVAPTVFEKHLKTPTAASNLAILRTDRHRLVHFAGDLPQVLFDMEVDGECKNIADDPANAQILLDLSRRMLSHRMVHADGTFAKTMVTSKGVRRSEGSEHSG